MSVCIQPLILLSCSAPSGAPFRSCGLFLTRGKMNKGGVEFPRALTVTRTVVFVPRSAELTNPTCFLFRRARILGGLLGTVVTPVSSVL